jgi:hypothetical protein
MVAVVQGKLGRYPSFEASVDKMCAYTHAATGRLPGIDRHVGLNPAEGRNKAVCSLLGDDDSDFVVFLDDDQVVQSDVLIRLGALLERYDLAAPLVLKVAPPFQSVAWVRIDGTLAPLVPWRLSGVHEVDEVGTGVLAVRKDVFRRLQPPWFRLGQIEHHPDAMMEDVYFSRSCRAAGYRIALDLDQQAGHTGQVTVWADTASGCVVLALGEGHKLAIPWRDLGAMPAPQPAAVGL